MEVAEMDVSTPESAVATIRIEDGVPWIGDQSFPWASGVDRSDHMEFHERRFRLTFENGWTLSVVFGSGSYSTNHDAFGGLGHFTEEVTTAELALWDSEDRWVEWQDSGDTVRGYCTAAFVLAAIEFAAGLPSTGFDFDTTVTL